MPGDEMFYITADGEKTDADIHEFILRREGLLPEEPPTSRRAADAEPPKGAPPDRHAVMPTPDDKKGSSQRLHLETPAD